MLAALKASKAGSAVAADGAADSAAAPAAAATAGMAALGLGGAAGAAGGGSKLGGLFGGGAAAGGAVKKSKWGKVRAVKSMISAVAEFAQLPGLHNLDKGEWKKLKDAIDYDDLKACIALYAEHKIDINSNVYYNPIIESRGRRRQSCAAIGLGTNWKGYGCAHHAAARGSPNVLKWALSHPDLIMGQRCREGKTILQYAEEDDSRANITLIKAEIARRG